VSILNIFGMLKITLILLIFQKTEGLGFGPLWSRHILFNKRNAYMSPVVGISQIQAGRPASDILVAGFNASRVAALATVGGQRFG
jgi:hypothetical protein